MKAVYQILQITIKHNHASPSYEPYDKCNKVFTTKSEAESWLNYYLDMAGFTGEKGLLVPEWSDELHDFTGKDVLKMFTKEESFSIVKMKLQGDIEDLVDYKDVESDLPF